MFCVALVTSGGGSSAAIHGNDKYFVLLPQGTITLLTDDD